MSQFGKYYIMMLECYITHDLDRKNHCSLTTLRCVTVVIAL